MNRTANLLLPGVEDYLGPAEKRFFGRGFRRVRYTMDNPRVGVDNGDVRADVTLGVHYPSDWSRKDAEDLRPHLSTLDAIILNGRMIELCLAGALGLTGAGLGRARIRRTRITAGGRPQEDLTALETVTVLRPSVVPVGSERAMSTARTAIGTMLVHSEVEHDPVDTVTGPSDHDVSVDLAGPARARYYGQAFAVRGQSIRDVQVDREQLRAEALLDVVDEEPVPALTGLEAAHHPMVTTVDVFVTALQLAQVMLYDLDGMSRAGSNTLWMRQTLLEYADGGPGPAAREGVRVVTELANLDLLPMKAATWRTADIVAEAAGLRLRCSVTHRLPDEVAS
jgi:hypothetical protein